jgi:hypothetical protein
MAMTRGEFERWYARERHRTVTELRAAGYVSAPCPCDVDGCPGWQAIAVPADAGPLERATILAGLVADAVKKFGEV